MFFFVVDGECCIFQWQKRIRGCAANIVILGMLISFEVFSTLDTSYQPYVGDDCIERTLVVDEKPLFASIAP